MMLDPTELPIKQKIAFGMWPDVTLTSRGIIPYIKRMKGDRVVVSIFGDSRGETGADILENCPKTRVVFLDGNGIVWKNHTTTFGPTPTANLHDYMDRIDETLGSTTDPNVVIVTKEICDQEVLEKAYELVNHGGYFCGNGHELVVVKESLGAMRRKVKIGTPINVSQRTTWFWIKR